MEADKRERWMRLCVEVADEQDSNRLLELISEIDRLLHEKEMRLRNVRREASRYAISKLLRKRHPSTAHGNRVNARLPTRLRGDGASKSKRHCTQAEPGVQHNARHSS